MHDSVSRSAESRLAEMPRKTQELSDRKKSLSRSEFQFSVSSIFLLTFLVAVSVLFLRELSLRFGPAASAVVILAVLSIFAHLAGAVLGGRLRAKDDVLEVDASETNDADWSDVKHIQPLEAQPNDFAPATELSHQKPLDRRPIYYAICTGSIFCSIVASVVLTWFMWDDLRVINVLFGAVSAAVIGGLIGCLLGSFYQVVRSALSEAQKDARF